VILGGGIVQRTHNGLPRVTIGMIVFNGEPFIRYNLRSVYPFAHQIVVVEGAVPGSAATARNDGHSSDGTLESVKSFCSEEDPEGKVVLVVAEDEGHVDGFWKGEKTQQSQAFASRATGDYLWQVDVDEFYQPHDMEKILQTLTERPELTAVSFHQTAFWGDLETFVDGWYLRRGAAEFHRLFRWEPGYSYVEHRPPTVLDQSGHDLRDQCWLRGRDLAEQGVRLYHYSLLLPKQVREKERYYQAAGWRAEADEWCEQVYFGLRRPFRVHNVYQYLSWLEGYSGEHPPEVRRMWRHVVEGRLGIETRNNDDVRRLLSSPAYRLARAALKALDPVDWSVRWLIGWASSAARRVGHGMKSALR